MGQSLMVAQNIGASPHLAEAGLACWIGYNILESAERRETGMPFRNGGGW